jgi:hypothetical protein
MLTSFRYLSAEWVENCKEERLLGVDITGQMDCPLLQPQTPLGTNEWAREALLLRLQEVAVNTNAALAKRFDINPSAAVTCVKPSGNSGQFLDVSSGIHPRYAPYYIRRLRLGAYTPMAKFLADEGVPFYPEVGSASLAEASVWVFDFPVKSPDSAVTRKDLTALQQLENWLTWKSNYTEHNPSCTVYVAADEWVGVGDWVWLHWDEIGGISFLPKDDHVYMLAPYEEISKDEYERLDKAMPWVNFDDLRYYEKGDTTDRARDYACVGGVCEF